MPQRSNAAAGEPQDFGAVGRYHVRVVPSDRRPDVLDIREHLETEGFSGYTRRGVRIYSNADLRDLIDMLEEVLLSGRLPESEPPPSTDNSNSH